MLNAFEASHQIRFQCFLLEDDSRLDTWRRGIHAAVEQDDVVLDLGAGMGILSLFACEAGARKVYAVEPAASWQLAALIAERNGYADRIELIPEFSQRVELPELADVLITDTLETFGLNGRMLSAVTDARRRLLKPGARLAPHTQTLYCAPIRAPEVHEYMVASWSAPASGFDVSPGRPFAANNMYPARIEREDFLADPAAWARVDLTTIETPAVSGSAEMTVTRAGEAHGLGGFFHAHLPGDAVITNDPREPTVRYRQALLPFDAPLALSVGDRLRVAIDSHDGVEWRWQLEAERDGEAAERIEGATLRGFPRSKRDLLDGSPAATPARSPRGDAELFVLGALDGACTIAELQRAVRERFGETVRSDSDATQLVREVVARAGA